MIGIDVSSWQRGLSLKKNAEYIDFVIMKATEGVGYTDVLLSDFTVQSTELNLLQGCYHFARPDLHSTVKDMEREADWFIEVMENHGLLGKAILILDWEVQPVDRVDLALAWLNRVLKITGVRPFIYASKSLLGSTFKSILNDWPIWMAAWPSELRRYIKDADAYIKAQNLNRTTVPWLIWQFSSTGIMVEFSGNTDLNYTDITAYDWNKLAAPMQDTDIKEQEIISDDMKWAIDLGLFKGGTGENKGKYLPKEPLTREQLATVLRRYDDILASQFGFG